MQYRPDIDGLRAVAIVPVMLFHGGVKLWGGGYVGVDIFFVISGFLITSLIIEQLLRDRFSFAEFYERRARRILPALFLVLLAVAVGTHFLFMPSDYVSFGKSLMGTSTFASNVVFWQESGYFEPNADVKPLLHTWSLAVEEQFYIFFPLYLWLAYRWLRGRCYLAILPILILSFWASVWGAENKPIATFFLAPGRTWELMLGALLALDLFPPLRPAWARNVTAFVGVALILWSVFTFSTSTTFPGWNSLYPCIGSALLIYCGAGESSVVNRWLSIRPLVFIGLVSYSLYLWHWVLLVLAKYYAIRSLTGPETAAVLILSLVISVVAWKTVEGPVRARQFLPSRTAAFSFAAAGLGLTFAAGSAIWYSEGFPSRLPSRAVVFAQGATDRSRFTDQCLVGLSDVVSVKSVTARLCLIGDEQSTEASFLVWGDSHASSVAPAIDAAAREQHRKGWFIAYAGCPPGSGLDRFDLAPPHQCGVFNRIVSDFVRQRLIRSLFLSARWPLYGSGRRYKEELGQTVFLTPGRRATENEAALENSLQQTLRSLQVANVYLVGGIPEIGYDVPTSLARQAMFGAAFSIEPTRKEFDERQSRSEAMLLRLEEIPGVKVLLPEKMLCNAAKCQIEEGGKPLYIDSDHLSVLGSQKLRPLFQAITF